MKTLHDNLALLGHSVKCRLSGFTGTVMSVSFDTTGCVMADVRPKVGKDGKMPDGRWVDTKCLDVLTKKPGIEQPPFIAAAKQLPATPIAPPGAAPKSGMTRDFDKSVR